FLALHDDAGWNVGDADGGVRLVDVLAAGPGGTVGVGPQVRGIDVDLLDFVDLRKDCDGAGRRVNASLCFRRRYSLDAMRPRLEFQSGKHASPRNAADDFLVTTVLARALAQDLDG